MKIFIMTDMECVSGITAAEYLKEDDPRYQITRKNLTLDVNAAAEGCFQEGADEVVVRDGHGLPDNLMLDLLDPRVTLAGGTLNNWSGLDETIDATMMVGQHAKAGTLNAFLDHTQSSKSVFDFTVNGISLGEIGQWALMTGHFDIPVVFLSGDEAGCAEADELLPGIETVSVGCAQGRQKLIPRRQPEVLQEITVQSAKAVKNITDAPVPYKLDLPHVLRLTLYQTAMVDANCRLRNDRTRVDGRTVKMTVHSPLEILNIFA